jgi:biotin transport system substrate-specific component
MLARALQRANSAVRVRVLGVALFAIATAVSARLSVLLPFSPVPLTLQVLVVVLGGLVLGARDGALAQLVYLQAILLGAPYTASGLSGPAAFVGPTAGYLLAFPVAALVAGWLSHRSGRGQVAWRALGGISALAVIYAGGMAWLSLLVGNVGMAWKLGVAPFVLADLAKVTLAVAAMSLRRR